MKDTMISVEGLAKRYRLGLVGGTTLHEDLSRLWAKICGKSDPTLTLHEVDQLAAQGKYVWALEDINFQVKQGEILGIIGSNGAGKSTLLKILTQITAPTDGVVKLRGKVASLLEVGTGFHPELTGRENIFLNGTILGMTRKEIERKFDAIVAFAEIEKFVDTPVKRYSSGMYVRLAFAVAAHLDPDILLVDEVLAVGDVAFQRKCLEKMEDVATGGRTILFVSHNMGAIRNLCHRAILLNDGKLVEDGNVGEVIDRYLEWNMGGQQTVFTFDTEEQLSCEEVTIWKVEILSKEKASISRIQGGEGLCIRMHFRDSKVSLEAKIGFNVVCRSVMGEELFHLCTEPISGFVVGQLPDKGYIDCVIKNLPLAGGSYVLDVGASRPGVEWRVHFPNLLQFQIEPWDAYGSGVALDQLHGLMAIPHNWDLCEYGEDYGGS